MSEDIDPGVVETVLLNGITARQMLFRSARARAGQTVVVHGVNGVVPNLVAQFARHAGIRVVGSASPRHHPQLRADGIEPVDYHGDVRAHVRDLAPDGVDAVFDHLGGSSFDRSFAVLRRGGTLVGYGTASQRDETDNMTVTFAGILAKFTRWSLSPNGKRAVFYNFWGDSRTRPAAFYRRMAEDLDEILPLVRDGAITARVAATVPLTEAAQALALAESGTVSGKVVIRP